MTDRELCWECIVRPDPNRENESSGCCPRLCDDCGGCVYQVPGNYYIEKWEEKTDD